MRLYRMLLSSVLLVILLQLATASTIQLDARQDSDSPSPSPSPTSSSNGSKSSEAASSTDKISITSSETKTAGSVAHSASKVVASATSKTSSPPSAATGQNGTASDDGTLPLQPKLSPGLALAGVLLLISGMVLCLVGIRNKRLHISMSVAFLSGLAVTVLIIYLMHPPVSDGVQGGFFVAVVVTAGLFGALSLIFPEVTEGLGCLLGGFCLSMWFLVLKPDGLIGSQGGRAIFIGAMSLIAFSFSFSHYTRQYALIVCMSFAGATATILGIDCFSRAGLKEFWLYLWNLNNNLFPLNTNHYPQTRGIRVEIAGIVLIFLFGIISQFKLWKLIKERRERKEARRLQNAENLERMEAEVGRKIESETNRERVRWEAVYGNKIGILESEDSVTKPSAGVTVREIDNSTSESFEMSNLSKEVRSRQDSSRSSAEAKPVIIPVGNDDDITEIDFSGNPVARDISRGNSLATGKSDSPKPSTEAGSGGYISERASPRASAPPPPPMFSPPFNIPYGETDTFKEAAPSTTAGLLNGGSLRRKGSQRRSSDFVRRTLSSRSRRERNSASQEELGMPLVAHEDDQASSVAATYDVLDEDELSLSDRSLPHGESDWEEDERPVDTMPTVSEIDSINHDKSERATTLAADEESKSEGEEEPEETASPSSEQKTATTLKGRRASRRASGMTAPDSEGGPSRPRSRAPSRPQSLHSIAQESFTGSLSEHLPEKLSKIALSYRTNEWAKYLETAEKPEEEELQEPESPGVSVEPVFAETVKKESKAKNVAGYQAPPPGAVTVRGNSVIVVPQTQTQRHQIAPQGSQTFSSTPVSLSRQSSSTHVDGASNIINMGGSLSRQSSATKIATRNPMRSSSGPLAGTPLGETPIEEESDPNRAFQQLNSPTPETLLGQRDSMMKNRVSTMGFNRITSNPNVNVIPASDAGGSRSGTQKGQHAESTPLTAEHLQGLEEESEDMTLAQRRQLIQARRASSSGNSGYSPPTSTRQRSYSQQYAASPQQQWGAPVATFDSHQPNRGVHSSMDDSRRENNLAKWRASLRENIDGPSTGAQRPTADEGRRAKMLNERRQTEAWKTMQERQAHARDAAFDSMMRRGDMQDLHREAIRKMQGVANKNAE